MTERQQREASRDPRGRWWAALVVGVVSIGLATALEPYVAEFDERAALMTYSAVVLAAFFLSLVRRRLGR